MTRDKKWVTLLLAIGLILLLGAVICGYWKLTGSTGNYLTMGSWQTQIEEIYQNPGPVSPGQEIEKQVYVSNTGTVDSLIRVAVKKMFGTSAENGGFQEDVSLDPEKIEITYNTDCWTLREDGYFYYTEILKAGTKTRKPLFSSYRLSDQMGNAYKGKEARIYVTMESLQADADVESLWQVTRKELNVGEISGTEGSKTRVVYLGQKGGFQLTEHSTDLFASFKNLTPGCARTQSIDIVNDSQEEVSLYLRAEATDQKSKNTEEAELIRQLLEKYAIIEVTGSDGRLYKGPVSGNLSGAGESMKQDLFLGRYRANESRELTVKLSLSSEMENQFQKLTGKVKWVFTAKGEDDESGVSAEVPATGDPVQLWMWLALLADSLVCLGMAGLLEAKRRRRERNEINERND